MRAIGDAMMSEAMESNRFFDALMSRPSGVITHIDEQARTITISDSAP